VFRPIPRQLGLVESRPPLHDQLSSHELRRPLSHDYLPDVSDSEAEVNRLPLTPAATAAVSRQQSIASHASHISCVTLNSGKPSR